DLAGARQTAEAVGDDNSRDYARAVSATAQARAGDFDGALRAAEEVSGSQKPNVLRAVAVAQAEAGKGQEAARTVSTVEGDYARALTWVAVAQAQVRAKDRDAAGKSLREALQI